jgi:murein L,D-transpeptidase YcbB/YkuD
MLVLWLPAAAKPENPSATDIQAYLAGDAYVARAGLPIDLAVVRRFYALRGYEPAWTSDASDASKAILAIASAAADGLAESDYHIDDIDALARSARPEAAIAYEVRLSASLLRYEHDLRMGRLEPGDVFHDVALPKDAFDPAAETDAALARNDLAEYLRQLAPPHPDYAQLRTALARYGAIASAGGWPQVPGDSEIKLDGNDPRLTVLSQRLAAEDSALLQNGPLDTVALRAAVERFQQRNGLRADGRVGRLTLRALTVSAPERVAQIAANMERWRWAPRSFGGRYIAVNAADATLQVVNDGKIILTSRVIVGKPRSPTAIFAAIVNAVTINPYWNIPTTIARHEILPKARRHPGYLAANHIVMGSSGQLRQLPGPDNSLGQIKLEMPNRFDAYLHDTPARILFQADERHLSHGCIRVEQIRPLASFALTADAAAGLEMIDAEITTGSNLRISLDNPLPVYVLYWTVVADQDGTVEFRPDVYGRDEELLAALAGQHPFGKVSSNTGNQCRRV